MQEYVSFKTKFQYLLQDPICFSDIRSTTFFWYQPDLDTGYQIGAIFNKQCIIYKTMNETRSYRHCSNGKSSTLLVFNMKSVHCDHIENYARRRGGSSILRLIKSYISIRVCIISLPFYYAHKLKHKQKTKQKKIVPAVQLSICCL